LIRRCGEGSYMSGKFNQHFCIDFIKLHRAKNLCYFPLSAGAAA
jgi:hypothetical protein